MHIKISKMYFSVDYGLFSCKNSSKTDKNEQNLDKI